jgi:predicted oxidoreductase/ferredoxin
MVKSDRRTLKIFSTDVVIIGGGLSGLSAAVAAGERGAKHIIILEKYCLPGGNGVFVEGLFASESQAQRRLAIEVLNDDIFNRAMAYSHQHLNARVLRAFINKSGDTIRWLEEKGLRFDHIPPHDTAHVIRTWHNPAGGGPAIIDVLIKDCTRMGVQILYDTTAREMLRDRSGRVTGVIAKGKDEDYRINAKSTVVATGGYPGNKEMLKRYNPEYAENLRSMGLPHMGDGILMAMKAGAVEEGLGRLQTLGPFFRGYGGREMGAAAVAGAHSIWVGRRGQRFVNEGLVNIFERVQSVLRQPGGTCYAIVDDSIVEHYMENIMGEAYLGSLRPRQPIRNPEIRNDLKLATQGLAAVEQADPELCNGCGICVGYCPVKAIVLRQAAAIIDPDTCISCRACSVYCPQHAINTRPVKKGLPLAIIANSLAEIADWIGADSRILKSTIDEYNDFCDDRYDAMFNKDRKYLMPLHTPPYYALKCVPGLLTTAGGIRVSDRMEAVDEMDRPIPGLFVSGNDVGGGFQTDTYYITMSGCTSGFAINSGRIAGENAAIKGSG